MDNAQPQAPAQPQGQPAPGASQGEQPNPSTRIMLAAMKIIYSNPKGFVDIVAQSSDPMQGIAHGTAIVLEKIKQSIKGVPPEVIQKLTPWVVQNIGPLIGHLIAELAVSAGVIDQSVLKGGGAQPDQAAEKAQQSPQAAPQGA